MSKIIVLIISIVLLQAIFIASADIYPSNDESQEFFVPFITLANIYVDDDAPPSGDGSYLHPFQKIQEGIDAADEGDKIFVFNGNYTEDLDIQKSIRLYGQNKESTFIRGNGQIRNTYEVKLTGFSVTTKEIGDHILFHIFKSSICEFYENNFYILHNGSHDDYSVCFWLNGSSNNIIRNNYFVGLRDYEYDLFTTHAIGMFFNSDENTVSNNTFIDLNSACQLNDFSSNNIVTDNLVENTAQAFYATFGKKNIFRKNNMYDSGGVVLLASSENIINKNTMTNEMIGIWAFFQANNNEIVANNIIGYSIYGINLTTCFNNHIYYNNFINNGYGYSFGAQAEDYLGVNFWYKSFGLFRGAGNYWDDYEGFDIFPPYGIGDIPYNIGPQKNVNKDRFPFMDPIDINNITITVRKVNNEFINQENYQFLKEQLTNELLTTESTLHLLNNVELCNN